jgi:hypothetical protein
LEDISGGGLSGSLPVFFEQRKNRILPGKDSSCTKFSLNPRLEADCRVNNTTISGRSRNFSIEFNADSATRTRNYADFNARVVTQDKRVLWTKGNNSSADYTDEEMPKSFLKAITTEKKAKRRD